MCIHNVCIELHVNKSKTLVELAINRAIVSLKFEVLYTLLNYLFILKYVTLTSNTNKTSY